MAKKAATQRPRKRPAAAMSEPPEEPESESPLESLGNAADNAAADGPDDPDADKYDARPLHEILSRARAEPIIDKCPLIRLQILDSVPRQATCVPALRSPQSYLPALIDAMLDRLSPRELRALVTLVEEKLNPWVLGSVCSGTDSPALVIAAIVNCLQNRGAKLEKMIHAFASEVSTRKQKFLRAMHPELERIYGNVSDLVARQATDYKKFPSTRSTTIPVFNTLIGGFPCTSVSALNKSSSANREVALIFKTN